MHSTKYIVGFVLAMTALVALVLSLLTTGLKPIHKKNESLFTKKAILSSLGDKLPTPLSEMTNDEVDAVFSGDVEQVVINMDGEVLTTDQVEAEGYLGGTAENVDMGKERKKPESERILPLYIYSQGGEKYYILSVRGKGLWDEIWANVALEDNFDTIAGISFDHKAETPGLGAEIKDNPGFYEQFKGKEIYDEDDIYRSVTVMKAGAKDPNHEVDGISGATITADGVTEMMQRGIKYYEPYFNKLNQG